VKAKREAVRPKANLLLAVIKKRLGKARNKQVVLLRKVSEDRGKTVRKTGEEKRLKQKP